jgi:hypothetical protein
MNNIVRIIQIFTITVALLLIVLLRNNSYLIPAVVVFMVLLEIVKYLIIQVNIWKKNYFAIGYKRFYLKGLIMEIIISFVLLMVNIFIPFHVFDTIIALLYLFVMLFLDTRKHIFIITKKHILHKHLFQIIQWKLSSLDKVYVFSHKIEFVKNHTKLKTAFDEQSDVATEIIRFIKPLIGQKLTVKNESIFYDFE